MAIRKFSLLTTSEIAESPFRSLQEVDDYLDQKVKEKLNELDALLRQYQLQFSRTEVRSSEELFIINRNGGDDKKKKPGSKFRIEKVDKVVVPKMDVLAQNFAVIEEIADQVERLDTLYNTMALNFRGVRGANDTLKNIKSMQKQFQAKMNKALNFLQTIGQKYEPAQFKELVEKTMVIVSEELDYQKYNQYLYAHTTKDGDLQFTHYVELQGLVNDEGEIYPQFYLVFTCKLVKSDEKNKVLPHFYVTVLREFATPGRFPLGREIDSPQRAMTVLGMMLDLENVGSGIGTLPHNLDPDKVSKDKLAMSSKVATFKVVPDGFEFTLLKGVTQKEAPEIFQSLWQDCKTMVSKLKPGKNEGDEPKLVMPSKARLKAKTGKDAEGRFTLRIWLTNLAQSDKISTQDLDFLQEHFGLDDAKLRRVVKVINED
jgi:hypothetical protein